MSGPRSCDQVVADVLRLFESLEFRSALELMEREGMHTPTTSPTSLNVPSRS